jgi:hypothetical protein
VDLPPLQDGEGAALDRLRAEALRPAAVETHHGKDRMRLLDPRFKYRNAAATNVTDTWKKHGFKPTTEAERAARQKQLQDDDSAPPNVTPITKRRTK